jgi:hypothetical protein
VKERKQRKSYRHFRRCSTTRAAAEVRRTPDGDEAARCADGGKPFLTEAAMAKPFLS